MQFEKGYLYHIYNQGNNRQKVFFDRENYLFFLRKINAYILPYADILAWCLMPNHFHLMVLVNEAELVVNSDTMTTISKQNSVNSDTMTTISTQNSHRITNSRSLNNSISIMLRSYSRAINKQENMSGSLFRAHTQAECINCPNGISPSFIKDSGITKINITQAEKQYPQICFDYIHQNPVKANLVNSAVDWEFSSAIDYAGIRTGKLINRIIAKDYINY